MKELIILKMVKYIKKYIIPTLQDLESKERKGEDVSFRANRYREILSAMYDLQTEVYKNMNNK